MLLQGRARHCVSSWLYGEIQWQLRLYSHTLVGALQLVILECYNSVTDFWLPLTFRRAGVPLHSVLTGGAPGPVGGQIKKQKGT